MSNVILTNTPPPTGVFGYIPGADGSSSSQLGNMASLTPDALLAFCNTQLQGIDNQVNTYMAQQNTQLQEKDALQQAQQVLEAAGPNGPQTADQYNQMIGSMQQVVESLPDGDPVKAQIQSLMQTMSTAAVGTNASPHSFQAFTSTSWGQYSSTLQGYGQDVDSNAEIGMVQIQSLVSQRQTIVQLTTNMMSTLSQTDQAIAQKIGT